MHKSIELGFIDLYILPRQSITWDEFIKNFPGPAIALDGIVIGGPRFDETTLHLNADHHDGVMREATMSTCKQVSVAIKGGIVDLFREATGRIAVLINDNDQDTTLALWLIYKYKLFEGYKSIPAVGRLLSITDYIDITAGSYPISVDDGVLEQYNWIFEPYNQMRSSGVLTSANAQQLMSCIEAMFLRLEEFLMGQAKAIPLDIRHEIIYQSEPFTLYNEIGINSRQYLFKHGMRAFVAYIASRPDGRKVYSVGRRIYTNFPMFKIYDAFNKAERTNEKPWGGSNLIGGARNLGSSLNWEQIREILLELLI